MTWKGPRIVLRQVERIPQAGPEAPLLVPVRDLRDRLQLGQADRIAASTGGRQEQNLLLDIGRQQEQVHDLGDARPAHLTQLGQRTIVGDAAGADEVLHADGQGHEAGESWHPAGFLGDGEDSLATPAEEMQVALNGGWEGHRWLSFT